MKKIVYWIQVASRFWALLRDTGPSVAMRVPAARLIGAADLTMVVYLIRKMADSTAAAVVAKEIRGATSARAHQRGGHQLIGIASGTK